MAGGMTTAPRLRRSHSCATPTIEAWVKDYRTPVVLSSDDSVDAVKLSRILLQGEELQGPEQKPRPPQPRRRSVRR